MAKKNLEESLLTEDWEEGVWFTEDSSDDNENDWNPMGFDVNDLPVDDNSNEVHALRKAKNLDDENEVKED